jgi:hypothetical protein
MPSTDASLYIRSPHESEFRPTIARMNRPEKGSTRAFVGWRAAIDPKHEPHTVIRFDIEMASAHPHVVLPENPMTCSHVDGIRNVQPSSSACDDCVLLRHGWLQLRMCMECGYVGCCDSSQNKHAIRHFRATQHPIARSIQPGEEWGWCYIDQLWFEKLVVPA